ncbi:hypothetical protein [Paracoccus laeviglucosivorans]|uniref:DUF3137 domain-containing protein n=1 Tax=Paracoccus laeviglucosivorans TaxID=1197861 RepID=A0A521F004_9RHOB|nr:hypothetical protein [Paracoccus laeviglucosivorans]SMO89465.1 hypothetical protein SAMN06265221_11717 [Paracoccus laeviglucosivorans]
MMMLPLMMVVLGAGLAWLALHLIADDKARRTARAGWLDGIDLQERRQAVAATGFARASGRRAGLTLDLQAVPDTLTFRKLPALWLLVTLPEPLPLRQRINLMMRPTGIEPFSAFDRLPHQTALTAGFPEDAALRSELPLTETEGALLARHIALFDDPRVKELVISPQGLRITWLAEEADRGRYLLFREAEMGRNALDPQALDPLVLALRDMREDILRTAV